MEVRFKKTHTNAVAPRKAYPTDAGFDLTAVSVHTDNDGCVVYDTGIAVEIPEGYVGYVFPRSSVAKFGVTLSNSVGVIDSHYRGSIKLKFRPAFGAICVYNILKNGEYTVLADLESIEACKIYKPGDRICQLIIMPIPEVEFKLAAELSETDRGDGGYGSSGK